LGQLALVAGCAYLAVPTPRLRVSLLPAAADPPRQERLSPEIREFMGLPPQIQKQALDYARRWTEANFERVDGCR